MKSNENVLETKRLHFEKHKRSAITTGISLLLMAITAGIAYGYLHAQIAIHGDAEATAQSIVQNSRLFIIEIFLWWIIVALDIIVSISLFNFFKKINSKISLITMMLRLLYSLILGISIIILSTALNSEENALSRIMQFENVWSIGLIIFGLHLFLLGYMAVNDSLMPKIISWVIVIGGLCYVLIHTLKAATDRFLDLSSMIEPYLVIPMALSEILLSVWLIYGVIKYSGKNATYV